MSRKANTLEAGNCTGQFTYSRNLYIAIKATFANTGVKGTTSELELAFEICNRLLHTTPKGAFFDKKPSYRKRIFGKVAKALCEAKLIECVDNRCHYKSEAKNKPPEKHRYLPQVLLYKAVMLGYHSTTLNGVKTHKYVKRDFSCQIILNNESGVPLGWTGQLMKKYQQGDTGLIFSFKFFLNILDREKCDYEKYRLMQSTFSAIGCNYTNSDLIPVHANTYNQSLSGRVFASSGPVCNLPRKARTALIPVNSINCVWYLDYSGCEFHVLLALLESKVIPYGDLYQALIKHVAERSKRRLTLDKVKVCITEIVSTKNWEAMYNLIDTGRSTKSAEEFLYFSIILALHDLFEVRYNTDYLYQNIALLEVPEVIEKLWNSEQPHSEIAKRLHEIINSTLKNKLKRPYVKEWISAINHGRTRSRILFKKDIPQINRSWNYIFYLDLLISVCTLFQCDYLKFLKNADKTYPKHILKTINAKFFFNALDSAVSPHGMDLSLGIPLHDGWCFPGTENQALKVKALMEKASKMYTGRVIPVDMEQVTIDEV
ncbi:hypothetical protein LNTAR_10201 [Lentisphaera araneosa HTCC2155]|uniref:Uncharacterized protein n=1 Tax=Lentisphaera araneosa HTCC2155 TaxID=313628 RepID=A6DIJ3_9BACT|nr:hypothetical protein [Lentisphaera araneosa]EDM28279.1 hypothetical protein LNTAR_10201 [Lentisphaera araneosa HTCC2155]